jgi:hypothetical protein
MAADMLKGDLRSQSPARWRGSIAQTSEFRSFPNIFNLNQIRRFPSVKAVWRRQTKGDSALVWLDDRVH